MTLRVDALRGFLDKHRGQPVLLFGFTFMVWRYLYEAARELDLRFDDGLLLHSGGWKKLIEEAVSPDTFKAALATDLGIRRVYNFYGMAEQVGSVFMEGESGFLHPPNFAEVIVRNPQTWKPAEIGETGVIEVLSTLPRSYPGHAILTEDLGIIHGRGASPCGRRGTYFSIVGRVPKVEIRGCSDTHAASLGA